MASKDVPATRRAVDSLPQHQVVGRLEVGFLVSDDFQEGVLKVEDLLGGFPIGLNLLFVFRDRISGWSVEDAGLDRVVAMPASLQNLVRA